MEIRGKESQYGKKKSSLVLKVN